MDHFNNGFRSLDVYMYMLVLLQICYIDDVFNTVFGDKPSDVYGIYVVLHVAYGRIYIEVA